MEVAAGQAKGDEEDPAGDQSVEQGQHLTDRQQAQRFGHTYKENVEEKQPVTLDLAARA